MPTEAANAGRLAATMLEVARTTSRPARMPQRFTTAPFRKDRARTASEDAPTEIMLALPYEKDQNSSLVNAAALYCRPDRSPTMRSQAEACSHPAALDEFGGEVAQADQLLSRGRLQGQPGIARQGTSLQTARPQSPTADRALLAIGLAL